MRARIVTHYTALQALFGPDDQPSTDGPGWVIATPGGTVVVSQSAVDEGRQYPSIGWRWQLDCDDAGPLPWVCKLVHTTTGSLASTVSDQPKPIVTPTALAQSYVDYLYQRSRAITDQLNSNDSSGDAHTDDHRLARFLLEAALTLQEALHHHEWTHSTLAQRHAWSARPRPARGPFDTDLTHWHAMVRWAYPASHLYQPDLSSDLVGLLHQHAARLAERTAEHWLQLTDELRDAHTEHQLTVYGLATSGLPTTQSTP